ncbi:uncharacterized protein LOC106081344 [Stomoxys calcitrans]|uniref:uncharacterized protein LOC106081344 n=1 Tax=Stomoxys calcitrans TaxID=35570 RepID=UPI0027E28890|nr:uncharacterized protein LOC106081344 [Stomoxys calcitrans]
MIQLLWCLIKYNSSNLEMHSKYLFLSVLAFCLFESITANRPRTCYSCKGINCMRTSRETTKQCSDPLDYCVTIFDNFNVIQKGCSYEIQESLRRRCDNNSVECHKCNTDRCNTLGQADYMCIQCDSSQNAKCASAPMELKPTRCGSPTAPNSYCFVQYNGKVIQRGCSRSVVEQEACKENPDCMLCLAGDIRVCNTANFKPGSLSLERIQL